MTLKFLISAMMTKDITAMSCKATSHDVHLPAEGDEHPWLPTGKAK